jgi:uncharacterized protein
LKTLERIERDSGRAVCFAAPRRICLSAVLVLSACVSLGRGAPVDQHYVLGGRLPWTSAAPARDFSDITIGVRRIQLAAYLETPFVLVRSGPNQVGFSEFHHWGEALGGGITRAVAGYLGDRADFRGIDVAPWPSGETYDFVVQLHMSRFEGVAPADTASSEGEVVMLASWEIIRQSDGDVITRGTTDYREAGWTVGDYAGLVTRLDAGLHLLTDELLASLDEAARSTLTKSVPTSIPPRE